MVLSRARKAHVHILRSGEGYGIFEKLQMMVLEQHVLACMLTGACRVKMDAGGIVTVGGLGCMVIELVFLHKESRLCRYL